MEINWAPILTRFGYADEEAMWKDLYEVKGFSVGQIAKRLDVSRNTIRQALKASTVKVRPRGGANNVRLDASPEALVEAIKARGVLAVAEELGVNYTTVYKRLRRLGLKVSDLVPAPPVGERQPWEDV